jgi:hypothetical protein
MRVTVTMLIVCTAAMKAHSAPSTKTMDVFRADGRNFTIIYDPRDGYNSITRTPRSVFWLAETTPRGVNEFIGPIPGMLAGPEDTAAAGWSANGQQFIYLANDERIAIEFERFRSLSPNVDSQFFHSAGLRRQRDPAFFGSHVGAILEMERAVIGPGSIAAAGSVGMGRTLVAFYLDPAAPGRILVEDDHRDGHVQIWEYTGEAPPATAKPAPIVEHQEPNVQKKSPEREPSPRQDILTQIAAKDDLEPGWTVIADQLLTLKPPMLLLCVPEGLYLIDDAGVVFSIENGAVTKIGSFSRWNDCDERVLLREGQSVSLYARRGQAWFTLDFKPDGENVGFPAGKELDEKLASDLSAIMAAREELRKQIPPHPKPAERGDKKNQ